MKKILLSFLLIISLIVVSGCEMDNTPTKKVENYLNNYKTLNDEVLTQLDDTINLDTIMTAEQKNNYKDILKRQYQNLVYQIKDEVVNGDTATVTAEIEVYDYYKQNKESDTYYETNSDEFRDESGNIVESKYIDYRLDKLKNYNDKVKYTIDFYLEKVDKTWVLQDVSEETRQKVHGLYAY